MTFRRPRLLLLTLAALLALSVVRPRESQGGCGCTKPPPPPASVRPNVTYAGLPVTLFSSTFVENAAYDVVFSGGGKTVAVTTNVVVLRDHADGVSKRQLVVMVPELPLGPASITVYPGGTKTPVLVISDEDFTVAPQPVIVSGWNGRTNVEKYQAAIGRDGTMYMSLDMSRVDIPLTFQVTAKNYPLHFTTNDVVFWNVQGFVMQLINQGIPGLAVVEAASDAKDSNILQYSRHEFVSYFLEHGERRPHALDPTDPAWHVDGTPHIDHNHLIVAIAGTLVPTAKDSRFSSPMPVPGATPEFTLSINTAGLFNHGVVGTEGVVVGGASVTDSEVMSNQQVALTGTASVTGRVTGDVVKGFDKATTNGSITASTSVEMGGGTVSTSTIKSNGKVDLYGKSQVIGNVAGYYVLMHEVAKVYGKVSGNTVTLLDRAVILSRDGAKQQPTQGIYTTVKVDTSDLLPVYMPQTVGQSGDVVIGTGQVITLAGPATYRVRNITIADGGVLMIDNTAGPVTLYVTGTITAGLTAQIALSVADPDTFAIYLSGGGDVVLPGAGNFVGVVYAPESNVTIQGTGRFLGAFIGKHVNVLGSASVTYADTLGDNEQMQSLAAVLDRILKSADAAASKATEIATTAAAGVPTAVAAANEAAAHAGTTVVVAAKTAAAAAASWASKAQEAAAEAVEIAADANKYYAQTAKAASALKVEDAQKAADLTAVTASKVDEWAAAAQAAIQSALRAREDAVKITQAAAVASAASASAAKQSASDAASYLSLATTAANDARTAWNATLSSYAKLATPAVQADVTAAQTATGVADGAVTQAMTAATAAQKAATAAAGAAALKDPANAAAYATTASQQLSAAIAANKTAQTARSSAVGAADDAAKLVNAATAACAMLTSNAKAAAADTANSASQAASYAAATAAQANIVSTAAAKVSSSGMTTALQTARTAVKTATDASNQAASTSKLAQNVVTAVANACAKLDVPGATASAAQGANASSTAAAAMKTAQSALSSATSAANSANKIVADATAACASSVSIAQKALNDASYNAQQTAAAAAAATAQMNLVSAAVLKVSNTTTKAALAAPRPRPRPPTLPPAKRRPPS